MNANATARTLSQEQSAKEADHEREIVLVRAQLAARESQLQTDLAQAQKSAHSEVERVRLRADAEAADLKASVNRLEVDLMKVSSVGSTHFWLIYMLTINQASKSKILELQALQEENARLLALEADKTAQAREHRSELEGQLSSTKATVDDMQSKLESVSSILSQTAASPVWLENAARALKAELMHVDIFTEQIETKLSDEASAKRAAQAELDDLLMVFGDLEEKVARYKVLILLGVANAFG